MASDPMSTNGGGEPPSETVRHDGPRCPAAVAGGSALAPRDIVAFAGPGAPADHTLPAA